MRLNGNVSCQVIPLLTALHGSQVVSVDCELYGGGGAVRALTLQAAAASLHTPARRVLPSARYLRLLRRGAAVHGVDESYRAWLDGLQSYEPSSAPAQLLGAAASAGILLAAAGPALPAYAAGRALGLLQTQSGDNGAAVGGGNDSLTSFVSGYVSAAQKLTWAVHDAALAPLLGSGCANGPPQR
jgi:hypothetical protein